ncbi:MAG: polysaccharide deacetylase family protein [Erysipelotrichaceae bacterium]|nr:polysaccharide deacetylase family protein [Erysipelotrichaceae bacterium]
MKKRRKITRKRKNNTTKVLASILVLLIFTLSIALGILFIQNQFENKNLRHTLGKGKYAEEKIEKGFEVLLVDNIPTIKIKKETLQLNSSLFTTDEQEKIKKQFVYNIYSQKDMLGDLYKDGVFLNELSDFNSYFSQSSFDDEFITLTHPNTEGLPLFIQIPYNNSANFINFVFKDKGFIADTIEDAPEIKENPIEIDPNKPMIALTFDDGPSKKYTLEILNKLNEYNAHATFFVLGNRIKGNEDIISAIVDSGSEVGGHSWDHQYLTKVDDEELDKQFNLVNDLVKQATNGRYSIKTFRPPYGAVNDHVKSKSPYPLIMWDVDTLDWKVKNKDKVIKNILDNAKDGSIILMHDIHGTSKDAALEVIPMLVEQGYQLVSVEELLTAKGIPLENGKVYYNAR